MLRKLFWTASGVHVEARRANDFFCMVGDRWAASFDRSNTSANFELPDIDTAVSREKWYLSQATALSSVMLGNLIVELDDECGELVPRRSAILIPVSIEIFSKEMIRKHVR